MPPEASAAAASETKSPPAAAAGNGAAAPPAPWYETLKPDADTVKFIEERKFPDFGAFAKSARESHDLARSRNVWERPDPNKLNEWKHWADLGWKEKLEDYTLKNPDKIPDGVVPDDAIRSLVAKFAHENRIPLPAAQGLYGKLFEHFSDLIVKRSAAMAKANADLEAGLRDEWKADYDRNCELARRAAKFLGGDDLPDAELEAIVKSPRLVRMFAKIGGLIGEDKIGEAGAGGALPESAASIEAELTRLEADPDFIKVITNERDPQYAGFVAKRQKLIDRLSALQQRAAKR